MHGAYRTLTAAVVLLLAVFLAYSNSMHADFHLDDYHQIVNNQNIRDISALPGFLTNPARSSYILGSSGYRPLTLVSFAVSYAISGYSVPGWHIMNIAMHFLNALLVFLIVRAVLRNAGGKESFALPLIAALAFALHPIATGAVTYISGRAVLLASLFYLFGFLCFLQFRESGRLPGRVKYVWVSAVPLLYLLGLLSKEMAVSLPASMLAYDFIFVMPKTGVRDKARAALVYVPMLAALGAFLMLKKALQGYATVGGSAYSVGVYLMSEAKVSLMYLRLMLLPTNQNADYYLPATYSPDAHVAASALLVAALIVLFYSLRMKDPAVSFLGFWFFIALAPESTFFPITDVAVEYRLYLPSAGLIAALVVGADRLLMPVAIRRAAAAVVLALLLILTLNRNSVWASENSLWRDVVGKSPGSPRARVYLAKSFMNAGRYMDAIAELRYSLKLDPEFPERFGTYNNLGLCYLALGMKDDAIGMFKAAIADNPNMLEAYQNLGGLYHLSGRYQDAVDTLKEAARLQPEYSPVRFNLGLAYEKLGRLDKAIEEMREAARYSPKDFNINFYLALLYWRNGMKQEASASASYALGLAGTENEKKGVLDLLDRLRQGG